MAPVPIGVSPSKAKKHDQPSLSTMADQREAKVSGKLKPLHIIEPKSAASSTFTRRVRTRPGNSRRLKGALRVSFAHPGPCSCRSLVWIQFLTSSEAASTFSCRNRFPAFRRIQLYALSRSSTEPSPRTRLRPIAGASGSETAHPPLMGRHSNCSSSRRCSGRVCADPRRPWPQWRLPSLGRSVLKKGKSRLAPEPPPLSAR